MKVIAHFLLGLLLISSSWPAQAEAWSAAQAIAEAKSLLQDDATQTKARKKIALAWLENLKNESPDLGDHRFLKALVLNLAGQKIEGSDHLKKLIVEDQGLNHQAAYFGYHLTKMLPALIRRALKNGEHDSLLPLTKALVDYGTLAPLDCLDLIGRKLARNTEPALRLTRTALAAYISDHPALTAPEKDHALARLYGRNSDRESLPPTQPPAPLSPHPFSQPQFLVIGGGGSYRNNQISLEKNVEFLLRLQTEQGLDKNQNHILFADGEDQGRDLQLRNEGVPELNKLLATILGSPSGLDLTYRSHHLDKVNGKSTEDNIRKYFDSLNLDPDRQLVVNFTGHGGRGEKDNAHNTSLYLWENKTLRMKDFTKMLDKTPEKAPVMLLMVQCYSGGFANVIFKEGDPKKGLSDHARCGFFSTVHNRVAAGCTPDIDEEDYREYSSYFLAALSGHTRTGKTIDPPDYDGDGKICFAEAHAYALLTSTTIDVSIKTSDAFLRHFSKLEDPKGTVQGTKSYSQLLRHGHPCDRAVLNGLSRQLNLNGDGRIDAMRQAVRALEKEKKSVDDKRKDLHKDLGSLRQELNKALKARWPELSNPWHPEVARLLKDEKDEILKLLKDHPKLAEFNEKQKKHKSLTNQGYDVDRQWARLQRFIRTAENVALEANLPAIAKPEIIVRYEALRSLEHGFIPSSSATNQIALTP